VTIKTILTPLSGTPRDATVLTAACALARAFEAHVDAVFSAPGAAALLPVMSEGISSAALEQLMRSAEEQLAEARKSAKSAYAAARGDAGLSERAAPGKGGGASIQWREAQAREDELVVRDSRFTDLVLLHHPGRLDAIQPSLTAETALMDGVRPILLVPEGAGMERVASVAIAWNGSDEGARAVAGAMPFVAHAEKVHILTAATGKTSGEAGAKLAAYLAWHGANATVSGVDPGKDEVGAALANAAKERGADLLVMGGYGRSRLREMIFGGVTRYMLNNPTLPVLMAH
jgi:nucleotide-binding universal stress UspA family protein